MEGYIDFQMCIEEPSFLEFVPTVVVNFIGCNFSCPFCYHINDSYQDESKNVEIKKIQQEIIRIIPNIYQILFTGGEPTIQKEALIKLLKFSKQNGLKTILYTNGSKFSTIKELVKKGLVSEYIVGINFRMEQNEIKRMTHSETFFIDSKKIRDEIYKTLELLYEHKHIFPLKISTVIIPGINSDESYLLDIAYLINKYHVEWIWLNYSQFSPYDGRKVKNKKLSEIKPFSPFEIQELADKIKEKYKTISIVIRDCY